MATAREKVIVGVFDTAGHAKEAIVDLRAAGFSAREIGLLTRDSEGDPAVRWFRELEGNRAATGAAIGAVTGAGGGAIWALGIAAGLLPAIGPVIAGGLLVAVAASAATGVAAGAVVGALVGLGVSDEEAAYYHREFERGRTILVVDPGGRASLVRTLLDAHGSKARDVRTEYTLGEQIAAAPPSR